MKVIHGVDAVAELKHAVGDPAQGPCRVIHGVDAVAELKQHRAVAQLEQANQVIHGVDAVAELKPVRRSP